MSGLGLKRGIRGNSAAEREALVTSCTGKARFGSANLAHEVNKRRNSQQKPGQVYRCTACGGWHIGRTPKDIRRLIASEVADRRGDR